MKATLATYVGRDYVTIYNIVLAMEGDPCHDLTFKGNTWTKETLKQLVERINKL